MNLTEVDRIIDSYRADEVGYDASLAALKKLGLSEVRADNLLVPLRKPDRLHTLISPSVRIATREPHQIVVQAYNGNVWNDRKVFHTISDDHAYTNAREFALDYAKRGL